MLCLKGAHTLLPDKLAGVEREIADKLVVDMEKAVNARIKLNEKKYPADKVRGRAVKYNDCDDGYQEIAACRFALPGGGMINPSSRAERSANPESRC